MDNSLGSQINYSLSCEDQCDLEKTIFACKLASPGLRARKATTITNLKKQVTQKKELENGFGYKFERTEAILAEINNFIRDEKQCCEFLNFEIISNEDQKEIWLNIAGARGVKDFIKTELEM